MEPCHVGAHERGGRTELGAATGRSSGAAARRSSGDGGRTKLGGAGPRRPNRAWSRTATAAGSRRFGNAPERPAIAVASQEPTNEGGSRRFASTIGRAARDRAF
jgi:hypothetical protein